MSKGIDQKTSDEIQNKESKVLEVAKGFLPKKRGRPKKTDTQEIMKKKKSAGVKSVTQIKKKNNSKGS